MSSHGVFRVSTVAIGEEAWGLMSLEHFHETLSRFSGIPSGDSIKGNDIYPNTKRQKECKLEERE